MTKNIQSLFKGFVLTKNKKCIEKLKGVTHFKSYEEVKNAPEFAGVLKDDTILIDIDDSYQSEIAMDIIEEEQLDCLVIQTNRGKHIVAKNTGKVHKCYTHTQLACGLTADIKVGSKTSYEVLKFNGEERFIEWDIEEGGAYQEVPKYFYPIKTNVDFINMCSGDGRNQAFFNYILTLTANGFSVDETRKCIGIMNNHTLRSPLADDELEVILRDEAFQKPVFFNDKTFLFDRFATWLKNTYHVGKINNQLYIYQNGIYVEGENLGTVIRENIPNIKKNQKAEVLDCLRDITECKTQADARYIAFRNGVLDIVTGQMQPFSPDLVITNQIPWDYNPEAYSELADDTLNKLACDDPTIRALLEECIGYCFYRANDYKKSFMLTGKGNNGKSTFLDCVKAILGDGNISALDLKELGDRFSTSMMFGKLANIGDDIGDDFLQGSQVATFKKVVSGNRIKAERKGQDPFEFNPYVKLLFSANDIPRMKDKTGAVLNRLVIIPFNARFTKYLPSGEIDPDYNPKIRYELVEQSSVEYLIRVGVEGLKRIIENQGFSKSDATEQMAEEYDLMNNPIKGFFAEQEEGYIFRETVQDIFTRYQLYCNDCGIKPETKISFGKTVAEMFQVESKNTRVNGKQVRFYKQI